MQNVDDAAFETQAWANRVASACIERYKALPRAGKPSANEWTPLAGIVSFVPFVQGRSNARDAGINEARDDHSVFLPFARVSLSSNTVCSSSVHLANSNETDGCTIAELDDGIPLRDVIETLSSVEASQDIETLRNGARVLAARAPRSSPEGTMTCVALGTGSKCLGANELISGGVRVHDSHAEVLARRGFLRYLLHQADRAFTAGDSDVLEACPGGCRVRPGVSFHVFLSEPPCGDAAIFLSDEHQERLAKRRREEDEDSQTSAKRFTAELSRAEANAVGIQNEGAHFITPHANSNPIKVDSHEGDSSNCQLKIITSLQHGSQNILVARELDSLSSGGVSLDSLLNFVSEATLQSVLRDSSTSPLMHACYETERKSVGAFAAEVPTTKELERPTSAPSDVHRTGAKCVGTGAQDQRTPGVGYHVLGAVRTKPGRGDPTLSLSCSDKMARWHAVGTQGALLSLMLPSPVRFRSVALADGVTWSAGSLRRALVGRACAKPAPLALAQASLPSPACRGEGARPCAAGVVWCDVPKRSHEVVARGLKQGVTKKAANTAAGRLRICRKELAKEFVRVYSAAAARRPTLGLKASHLHQHLAGPRCETVESLCGANDAQSWVNREGMGGPSAVSDGRRCQNLTTGRFHDNNIVCALNSNGVTALDGDTFIKCFGGEDLLLGSAAIQQGVDIPTAGEGVPGDDMDCGHGEKNGGCVAEVLGKMTYGQLKVTAGDYQRRWRHVRELHFPGWTKKPEDLQDFVVGNE